MEILLATKNKNKFKELKNIFDQSNSEHEKYYVPHAKTERYAKSAIPHMARQLNANTQWV